MISQRIFKIFGIQKTNLKNNCAPFFTPKNLSNKIYEKQLKLVSNLSY